MTSATYAKKKRHLKVVAHVQAIYQVVDRVIMETNTNTPEGRSITCRRGCNACCRMSTLITPSEALFIVERYPELVRDRLNGIQEQSRIVESICAKYKNSTFEYEREIAADWWNLQIPCVFLADNGDCSIYDARPVPCRTHFVADDPSLCAKVPAVGINHVVPTALRQEAYEAVTNVWLNTQTGERRSIPIGSLPKMVLIAYRTWKTL